MARNLQMEYPSMVNKFNDTLHTSFVKHDIYWKVHYLHSRSIYLLPSYISRAFEQLDELITLLMNSADKKRRRKITGRVKWSPEYEKVMDLVELWILLKT